MTLSQILDCGARLTGLPVARGGVVLDGQRGEHGDGVGDHARNDEALGGAMGIGESGVDVASELSHFAP